MKKYIALLMVVFLSIATAAPAQAREWWAEQIADGDEYHDVKVIGQWPDDVLTNEIMVNTITFRPKVISAKAYNKTTKVTADITTAARAVIIQYSTDGKKWEQRTYRNVSYKGPVTAVRKWQTKLHKADYYSSWAARQFKQGGKTLAYKKTASMRTMMANLFFDDTLIDGIRNKVKCVKTFNIPVRAKEVRIRYAYTGLTKGCFSDWLTIKVR